MAQFVVAAFPRGRSLNMDAQSQLPQGSESATAKGSIDASQQPSSTPSDECSAGAEEVTCAGIPAGAFAKLSEHQKTCWKNEASLTPEVGFCGTIFVPIHTASMSLSSCVATKS